MPLLSRSLCYRILLSFFSVIVFLGLLELICRISYHPEQRSIEGIFDYSPEKSFALKKNFSGLFEGKTVVTNSRGYRDAEIPVEKASDEVRILVVGDSISFGHKVTVEDTYANQLEEMLRKEYPTQEIEVINTAVPGNSAMEEYYDLKRGMELHPDIVLIQFSPNDLDEPYGYRTELGGEGIDYHNVPQSSFFHYFLSQRSALYLFLLDLKNRLLFGTTDTETIKTLAKQKEDKTVFNLYKGPNTEQVHQVWQLYFKWLGRMLSICQREHIQCFVVESPYMLQLDSLNAETFPGLKDIQTFAQGYGAETVDLLPPIRAVVTQRIIEEQHLAPTTTYFDLQVQFPNEIEKQKNVLSFDGNHFTPQGHLEVAKFLFELLKNQPAFHRSGNERQK